jgi:hypothetical protein
MGLENNKNTLWKCLFERSHQSGEKKCASFRFSPKSLAKKCHNFHREKIIMQQNINLCPSGIFQNSSINFYRPVYERKKVHMRSSIRDKLLLISFVLIVHQRQALASADIFETTD